MLFVFVYGRTRILARQNDIFGENARNLQNTPIVVLAAVL